MSLTSPKEKLSDQAKWNYSPFTNTMLNSGGTYTVLASSDNEKIISNKIPDDLDRIAGLVHIVTFNDSDKYIKVYTEYLSQWFSLSLGAQRVLAYIMYALPINKDSVFIDLKEIKAYTHYKSEVSIYNGLNDLINKKIIARSTDADLYFTNPLYICNGKRASFTEAIQLSAAGDADRVKRSYSQGVKRDQDPNADIEGVEMPPVQGGLLSK